MSEHAAPSIPIEKQRAPRRKVWRWLLRGLLVLLLLIVLIPLGALLALRSSWGERQIADLAQSLLAAQGYDLRIGGIEGPLPIHLLLRDISLSDSQGLLFRASELELSLAWRSLLSKTLRLDLLALRQPELFRLPSTAGSGEPTPPQNPETPLSLPTLPLALEAEALRIEGGILHPAALGFSPPENAPPLLASLHTLTVDILAGAALRQGVATAHADAHAQTNNDMALHLALKDLRFNFDAALQGTGEATALLEAPLGGRRETLSLALETRVNLPPHAPLNRLSLAVPRLSLQGMGLECSMNGLLDLAAGSLTAAIALDSPPGAAWQTLLTDLGGLDQKLLAALADPLHLKGNLAASAKGRVTLALDTLRAGVLTASGDLAALPGPGESLGTGLDRLLHDGSLEAKLRLAVSDLAPLASGFSGPVRAELDASGNLGKLSGKLTASSPRLGTRAGDIQALQLDLTAALTSLNNGAGLRGNGRLRASAAGAPGGPARAGAIWELSLPLIGALLPPAMPAVATAAPLPEQGPNTTPGDALPKETGDRPAPARAAARGPEPLAAPGTAPETRPAGTPVAGDTVQTAEAAAPLPSSVPSSPDIAALRRDGSLSLRELDIHGFGLDLRGDLRATVAAALLAPTPEEKHRMQSRETHRAAYDLGTLWPEGLALNGTAALAVRDWQPLADISGLDFQGEDVAADLRFVHSGGIQALAADLRLASFSLPEQANGETAGRQLLSLNRLTAALEARLQRPYPSIHLEAQSEGGQAGPAAWNSLTASLESNGRQGNFAVGLTADDLLALPGAAAVDASPRNQQIRIVQASETPRRRRAGSSTLAPEERQAARQARRQQRLEKRAAQRANAQHIEIKGAYDLAAKELTVETLSARDRARQLALHQQGALRASFADGIRISGLNLAMTPGGTLTADATLRPGTLAARANLSALPLGLVESFIKAGLPEGLLSAAVDIRQGRQGPEGTLQARLALDHAALGLPLPDPSATAPPDFSLEAALGRKNGKLLLEGHGTLALLQDLSPRAELNGAPPSGPLTFSLPLRLEANGLPLPDMQAPFRAAFTWTGSLQPLWQVVPLPDMEASGLVSVNAAVSGTLAKPVFSGAAYLVNGRFTDKAAGYMLADIALEATVSEEGAIAMLLSATDGAKGSLGLEGSLDPHRDEPLNFRGQILHLAPLHRDDLSITLSGLLSAKGSLAAPRVGAEIIVERGELLLTSLGGGSIPTLDISEPAQEAMERRYGPALDVKVSVPRRFFIRGHGLDSEWGGNLAVTGRASEPILVGSLHPVRGTFDLLSRTFSFNDGEITFDGGTRINPGINLELTYTSPNLEAIIRARGTAAKPRLTLESRPPVPQDEVLAQVLFGKRLSELSRFEALQLANGLRELAGFGTGEFNPLADIRKATGFDVLRLGSTGDDGQARSDSGLGENLTGPSAGADSMDAAGDPTLEAGKYIGDDIYIGVEQGLTQEDTAVRVEIELTPSITVQGRTGTTSSQVGIGWKNDY